MYCGNCVLGDRVLDQKVNKCCDRNTSNAYVCDFLDYKLGLLGQIGEGADTVDSS